MQVVEKAVLVATPVKNAKDHIEKYFANLAAMTYPKCACSCPLHLAVCSRPCQQCFSSTSPACTIAAGA